MTAPRDDSSVLGALVRWAVRHRWAVLALAAGFVAVAWQAFRALPIEAFPDVTDPAVEVVAAFPGQSAEEVERRVTLELERVLAGTPRLTNLRTVSVFGLALATLRFEEGSVDRDNRAQVAERLREATLPSGTEAVLGPQATPVGQIYRYTLRGPRSLRELRAIQDWVVERRLRAVPGVADVVTFGGFERQYEVRIDPARIAGAGVSVAEVFQALERANANAGGGYVGIGSQEFVVRSLGAMRNPADIGGALVREREGMPVRVRDVADVVEGSRPRRGAVGRGEEGEVVEGIVLLRRGENPSEVLTTLRARVAELNGRILPRDVRIDAFYDRGALIDATLSTVSHNLAHGALLVIVVLTLFLGTLRGALIVATVIPLALLTAFLGLRLLGRSANLISLGAIDFGILVDGAVVVLETTLHALAASRARGAARRELIATASGSVARPVVFAMLIIIAGLIPVFTLQRVEGRIFAPMAFTYVFALVGALIAATTVVPALQAIALPRNVPASDLRWLVATRTGYLRALSYARRHRALVALVTLGAVAGLASYGRRVGTEFLPELNEGGLYITAIFPATISLEEAREHVPAMRARIMALPEARDVLSHIGRPEEATQVEGPNNVEFFVALAPADAWRAGLSRRDLEDELRASLGEIPGVQYNFSQPITDRVYETISGIIGQVVVKVRGEDLAQLTALADRLRDRLATVPGVTDLSIYQAGDAPQLSIELDRDRLARFGLTVDEAQQTISTALGGVVATQLWQGERRYGVALRLPDSVRADPEALGRLVIGDSARRVTLAEIADVRFARGRAAIWREDLARFVAIKFNVRGRDLGSVVADARARTANIELPEGVTMSWGGEFENQQRAMKRLALVVPLALGAIVLLLFMIFGRWRPALLIAALLPVAAVGAVATLRAAGENFSVAAAVGCVALLGQVALAGVLVCDRIDRAVAEGADDPTLAGAGDALRAVLLTTSLALLGLVPAALSTGMGSETQRPFAIAIIGGLLAALPAVVVLLPLLYASRRRPAAGGPPVAGVAAAVALALAGAVVLAPAAASAQQRPDAARESELLARWLRHGRELESLRAQVSAARFDIVAAGTLPNPELQITGSALLAGTPPDGRVNYAAQLSMPLLVSGQLDARRGAALRMLSVAEANVAVALWSRAAELRTLMLERAFAAERVAQLALSIDELSTVEQNVRSRAAAGVGTPYDALRLATAVATVRAELASAELARDRAESQLLAQISDPTLLGASVSAGGLATLGGGSDEAALVAFARRQRPDLELSRRGVVGAEAAATRYRRDALPAPTVWAGAGVTHDEASVSVLAGVSLPLPVFDRNQGAIGRALAEASGHRAQVAALEARIATEVRGALRTRAQARAALDAFEHSAVSSSADLLGRAQRAYQAGAFSIAELLDAYRANWEARRGLVDLARGLAVAEADLIRALGLVVVTAAPTP